MTQASREGIRVVLDLAMFFKGKRKKCYYFIDLTTNRFVRDVCEAIQSRFEIKNSVSLELNGCYVPKNEDVRVFHNEDLIKVFGANKSKNNLNSLNLNCENEGHEDSENIVRFVPDTCNGGKLKRPKLNDEIINDEMTAVSKPKKKCKSKTVNFKEETDNNAESVKERKKCSKKRTLTSKLVNVEETDNYDGSVKESKKCAKNKTQNSKLVNVELGTFTESEESVKLSNISDIDAKLIGTSKAVTNTPSIDIEEKIVTKAVKVQEKDFDESDNLEIPHFETCLDPETVSTLPEHNRACQVSHNNNLDTTKGESTQDQDQSPIKFEDKFCKKRRRRRRKKILIVNELSSEQNCFAESFTLTSSVDKSVKKAVHIKFSDNDENNESHSNDSYSNNSCENNGTNSHTPYQQSVKASRNLENSKGSNYKNCYESKHTSVVSSPIVLTDNNGFISNNFLPTSSTTPVIFECKKINKMMNNEPEKNEIDKTFLKYPLLNSTPKVDDIIAFKKWKMDANYSPSVSSFITAKVLQVLENEDHIALRILNGHSEFEEPKGKFSLEEEGEEDEEVEEKGEKEKNKQSKRIEISDIEMKVSDLLEIRIMYP